MIFGWKDEDHILELHNNKMVFVVTCSSFSLGAIILFHLSSVSEELKIFAQKLSRSFYVDNCISSIDNKAKLKDFIVNTTEIMAKANMELYIESCRNYTIKNLNLKINKYKIKFPHAYQCL